MASSPEVTEAQVLRLMRASLAMWQIGATLDARSGGGWEVGTDDGRSLEIGRAPSGIPFRWLVTIDAGRERPASSVAGLLRILRSTLDPYWRSGRARIVALTLPAQSSANRVDTPGPHFIEEDSGGGSIIPVTVVTGFLGSGKTTLLARLLKSPAFARTAVIINEFGEVGIDHDLVAASEESFVTLETGCICCMVRGDLEATLADLVARRRSGELPAFERIVIETSGLADPGPVLNAVMAETGRGAGLALEGVVTTIDAVNGPETLARETQAARQVAIADRLIVTKTDLAPRALEQGLTAQVRALNAHAELLSAVHGRITPEALIGRGPLHHVPDEHAAPATMDATGHDTDITCVAIRRSRPLPALALPLVLEALADHVGADLLRLKALVHVAEHPAQPAVIHGVQHLFHEPQWLPAWPSDDYSTRIVLIGRGLSQLWLEALTEAIVAEVEEVTAGSHER